MKKDACGSQEESECQLLEFSTSRGTGCIQFFPKSMHESEHKESAVTGRGTRDAGLLLDCDSNSTNYDPNSRISEVK